MLHERILRQDPALRPPPRRRLVVRTAQGGSVLPSPAAAPRTRVPARGGCGDPRRHRRVPTVDAPRRPGGAARHRRRAGSARDPEARRDHRAARDRSRLRRRGRRRRRGVGREHAPGDRVAHRSRRRPRRQRSTSGRFRSRWRSAGDGCGWRAGRTEQVARWIRSRNRVVQRIAVGNGLRAVAVGHGAVWAAAALDGQVARIDLRSGRVTRRIAVPGRPPRWRRAPTKSGWPPRRPAPSCALTRARPRSSTRSPSATAPAPSRSASAPSGSPTARTGPCRG